MRPYGHGPAPAPRQHAEQRPGPVSRYDALTGRHGCRQRQPVRTALRNVQPPAQPGWARRNERAAREPRSRNRYPRHGPITADPHEAEPRAVNRDPLELDAANIENAAPSWPAATAIRDSRP